MVHALANALFSSARGASSGRARHVGGTSGGGYEPLREASVHSQGGTAVDGYDALDYACENIQERLDGIGVRLNSIGARLHERHSEAAATESSIVARVTWVAS